MPARGLPAPLVTTTPPNHLSARPKHSATVLLSYLGSRWGGNVSGSFVGRRPDSDFLGFNIDHAAGYVRADIGAWYAIHQRLTLFVNVENAFSIIYRVGGRAVIPQRLVALGMVLILTVLLPLSLGAASLVTVRSSDPTIHNVHAATNANRVNPGAMPSSQCATVSHL